MVHGPHVLITRPSGQHELFSQACKALGFQVSHLPSLTIRAMDNASVQSRLVSRADSILFTSLNAVEYANALLPLPWPEVAVRAIGPATADALRCHGQALASEPIAPYTSEALLEILKSIPPERLIIIKGQGGRTLIRERLDELGWQVHSIDVYRRMLPEPSPTTLQEIFGKPAPDIVTVTSNESLSNLVTMVGEHRSVLLGLPLVVNSERCATLASSLGFENAALVAQPAGDQGQLSVLENWLQHAAVDSQT